MLCAVTAVLALVVVVDVVAVVAVDVVAALALKPPILSRKHGQQSLPRKLASNPSSHSTPARHPEHGQFQ